MNPLATPKGLALVAAVSAAAGWFTPAAVAQQTSPIALQGRLVGVPDGVQQVTLNIWDSEFGGTPVASVTVPATISDGVFSLLAELPDATFNGGARWWSAAVEGAVETGRTQVASVPTSLSTRGLAVTAEGFLGIGHNSPQRMLHMDTGAYNPTLVWGTSANPAGNRWGGLTLERTTGAMSLHTFDDEVQSVPRHLLWMERDGRTGIGTIDPQRILHIDSREANATVVLGRSPNPSGNRWLGLTCEVDSGDFSISAFDDQVQAVTRQLLVARRSGQVDVAVLRITGGSDLAEPFPSSPRDEQSIEPKPGMVLSIDPANPGALRVSTDAYDTRVAGVYSGGNGLPTGMVMGKEGCELTSPGDDRLPLAMTGRVWVYADESNGVIIPGDRLTTSGIRPGHALRVADESRSIGAVIGKAMTGVDPDSGMVLVLVNLQ